MNMKVSSQSLPVMIRSDLFVLWIVATTSLCAGLLLNQFRDKPLSLLYQTKEERLDRAVAKISTQESHAVKATRSLSQNLSIEEFKAFVQEKQGPVLDARPEIFHRIGHIPGAISLPREEFEKAYLKLKDQLEPYKDRSIAIYCSSNSCEDSELVRKALTKLGYTQVAVFNDGWNAWTQANLPEEKQ